MIDPNSFFGVPLEAGAEDSEAIEVPTNVN